MQASYSTPLAQAAICAQPCRLPHHGKSSLLLLPAWWHWLSWETRGLGRLWVQMLSGYCTRVLQQPSPRYKSKPHLPELLVENQQGAVRKGVSSA